MLDTEHRTSECVDALRSALDDAVSLPLSCMSRRELGALVCALQGVLAQTEALTVAATAAADAAAIHVDAGVRNVESFVAANTNGSAKSVARDRHLGRWLGQYPVFEEAFGRGELTRRHVEDLRRACNSRTASSMSRDQEQLAVAGRDCDYVGFVQVLSYWLLAADPDGEEPAAQHEARTASITKRGDGSVAGSFQFGAIDGDIIKTAVDAEAKRLRRQDRADGVDRSAAQRRADALKNLITRGAAAPNGGTNRPLFHLVMSQQVADEALAWLLDPDAMPDPVETDPVDIDRRCELVDGTPVHPKEAIAHLAGATLRRLVLGADSEILDLGTPVRLFPKHLKQAALAAQRGRCANRCDAETHSLEADHVHPHSRGGHSATDNLECLCAWCNGTKGSQLPDDPAPDDPDPPLIE